MPGHRPVCAGSDPFRCRAELRAPTAGKRRLDRASLALGDAFQHQLEDALRE